MTDDRVVAGTRELRYGPHPAQVAELTVPAGARRLVVLVHGGYWRARYDRRLQDAVVAALVSRGLAVGNLDYRAVPPGPNDGGGWPHTFDDVAAAFEAVVAAASGAGLPADDVTAVGHSAGGTLALWLATRPAPAVRPARVVAQAAICDLVAGVAQGLGDGAILDLMGATPQQRTGAYAAASPAARLPLGVPVLAVTGAEDDTVPAVQSHAFVAAARAAGDDATLVVVPGEDHFAALDPASGCWAETVRWLAAASSPFG